MAGCQRPRWFARLSIWVFHKIFPRIDLAEAVRGSRKDYASLQDFFTRTIRPGSRPLADSLLVSCSDGVFGQSGAIEKGTLIQAKGILYSAREFLQDPDLARQFEGGAFSTVYLAPWNYHRVHHAVTGELVACRHIPGDLWPVHRQAVEGIPGLFARNERAWVAVRTPVGTAIAVMVGAYNVGSIRLTACPGLGRDLRGLWTPPAPAAIAAGDELGIFEMGSTVVLLVDKALREASGGRAFPVPGASVRAGQALAFPG